MSIKPEDEANVVVFLCSEDASMIREQSIVVDGGVSLYPAGANLEVGEQ